MSQETRACQNCKSAFTIEPEDFNFYQKIKVPPPTFCPECRFERRVMFRNERVLYKRTCDLCGQGILSVFAPDKPYVVYCSPCWWSDKWEALDYGQEYNPDRSFFEQFLELERKVPLPALIVDYPTLVNSDYVNHAGHSKNCYWIFDSDFCENVHYATIAVSNKDSMDATILGESELCYEIINGGKCYRVFFSEDVTGCHDVFFSKNLVGCSNCFGCINLRNKSYHIFNKPYTKEEYEKKFKEFRLDSHAEIEKLKKEISAFYKTQPHKYMRGLHNTNASGDYVYYSKNAHLSYQVRNAEDVKFCQRLSIAPAKDAYDYTEWGSNAQRIYECITVGEYVNTIRFTSFAFKNSMSVEYSMGVVTSSDVFGCISIKNKKYCILNREYPEDEYGKLREHIIKAMNEEPYVDAKGREWRYGEFFPYDLSFFDYNESTAIQYFKRGREEVLKNGWRWRDAARPQYDVTLPASRIPDSIREVNDSILKEVLGCAGCGKAFRLTGAELDLLRRFGFPIPRLCPECRHMERQSRLNPPRFWDRTCAKCGTAITTSYAPDRPEIVYCESCYNAEVS